MPVYWFGDLDDRVCIPCSADLAAAAERLLAVKSRRQTFLSPDWRVAVSCGFCTDRSEYLRKLRDLTIYCAEQQIRTLYGESDRELLQMVRMLDQMDEVINLLTGRLGEWYQIRDPKFSRKYRTVPAKSLLGMIKKRGGGSMYGIIEEIEHLSHARAALMKEVSASADAVLPNCSALLGGLVAARLVARAGGLAVLSRLSSSSIQVMGAQNALFSHLRSKSPPPKHGIIFQHRRVHNAPQEVRGRVARVLAAKLAIAARLDYYRGEISTDFINTAQAHIDRAGQVKINDPD
jgi:nucleolar protein 56